MQSSRPRKTSGAASRAASTKRKRNSDDGAPSKQQRFAESRSTLEQARQYELVTAHMPLSALETHWSLGAEHRVENRPINRVHRQRLLDTFMQGDAHRTDPRNYILVKASKKDTDNMLNYLEATNGMNDEGIQQFFAWHRVNGDRKVEVLNGQHRLAAWHDYISKSKTPTHELSWICVFYDKNKLPPELDRKLRINRPETAMEDKPGDVWMQIVAAASFNSKLQSGDANLEREIKNVLQLASGDKVPHRLVTIWRNKRWRKKATEWCGTTIGRETFNLSKWDCLISLRIDEFWFHMFDHVKATLERLPGDATLNVGLSDWNKLATLVSTGTERLTSVQELFYPASKLGDELGSSNRRRRDFLAAYNDDLYLEACKYIKGTSDIRFWDFQKVLKVANVDLQQLRRVMEHVVAWLNANPTPIRDQRDNNKPPLRLDLKPGLRQLQAGEESGIGQGLKMPPPKNLLDATETSQERASILLQQEVIEYVLDKLDEFLSPNASPWLKLSPDGPDETGYSDRFRVEPWKWLLRIVNRYAKREVHPEWRTLRPEQLDLRLIAQNGSQTICSQLEIAGYGELREKMASQAFQGELAEWLSKRFHDGLQNDAATHSRAQSRADGNVIGDPYDVPEDSDSQGFEVSEADESSDGAPLSGPASASPTAVPAASASPNSASPSVSPAASPAAFTSPESASPSASPAASPAASASPDSGSSFVSARAFAPARNNLAVSPGLRSRPTLSRVSNHGQELERRPHNSLKTTISTRDQVRERHYNAPTNGLASPSYRPKNPSFSKQQRKVQSPAVAAIPDKPARHAEAGWRTSTHATGKRAR